MDPAIYELLSGPLADEVQAVLRLEPGERPPAGVRIVARFGPVATCRIRRRDVVRIRRHAAVASLKAPRLIGADPEPASAEGDGVAPSTSDERRPPGLRATGRGAIVAVLDWGCDFAHPDFRRADGSTRILALWDQRNEPAGGRRPDPYGYGRAFGSAAIDAALAAPDPYAALGYHPGTDDPGERGAHGTHVLSIAAGGGAGGPSGMAPDADIVFVHLSTAGVSAAANLGDSVSILEALHFADGIAGPRPCVVNASVGRHGGPHDGTTLVEQAFDHLVRSRHGRAIVQSTGNYYEACTHASGRVLPGSTRTLRWQVDPTDVTANELEIWYPSCDELSVTLRGPSGLTPVEIRPGQRAPIHGPAGEVGRAYHRRSDPNNGRHHVDVFLDAGAPGGTWRVDLRAIDVVDGRFDAWVERDATCPGCQSRFHPGDCSPTATTGTICNGLRPLAIGAYDGRDPARPVARFSSVGPTVDGRWKPEVLAPGVDVVAARSSPEGAAPAARYTTKSGTSMAAPYVAGLIACLYEAAAGDLSINDVRTSLLDTAEEVGVEATGRVAAGYVDPVAAEAAVAGRVLIRPHPSRGVDAAMNVVPLGSLSPASIFDAVVLGTDPALMSVLDGGFDVVGRPGDNLHGPLEPGDVLITRALGEAGIGGTFVVTDGGLLGAPDLLRAGYTPDSLDLGSYALVEPDPNHVPVGRRVLGPDGTIAADRVVLRPWVERVDPFEPRYGSGGCRCGTAPAGFSNEDFGAEAVTCTPAAEPDPTGRGPHPLILNGSNRPVVGHAQICLNNWIATFEAGEVCVDASPATRAFVTDSLARLAANGQKPLVVDCRFGRNTDTATRAFQACKAINRDGKIGQITWPMLDVYAGGRPVPPAAGVTYQIFVDSGRNGLLAAGPATWTFGAAGSGAAVLVNNDDDGANGAPDNEDRTVDAGNDASELAALVLDSGGAAPPGGVTIELRVSDPQRLRVFESRPSGSQEIIGPTQGATHRFANVSSNRIELAMEGIRYAGGGSNGEVTLTATTTIAASPPSTSTTVIRLAPWIISNHLDAAEKVFVADLGLENQRFRNDLRPLVTAAGCTLVERTATPADRWIQDCMEFGYAHVPPAVLRTVFKAPRPRPLQTVARSLLTDQLGFVAVGTLVPEASEDSTGNLEATPPTTSSAGKRYPMGRIYYSPGSAIQPFDPEVRDFLRSQIVQEPIEVDLTWLTVGHVDEVISVVRAPTPRGWKLVLASPRLAYQLLDGVAAADPNARMLVGRRFPNEEGPPTDVERTVRDFLTQNDDFHPDLRSINPGHVARPLRTYNQDRDRNMADVRAIMQPALGLRDDEIVELPMVFMPNPATPSVADAMTGAVVNMLVINQHCIIPKAFGPIVGGVDKFEDDVRTKLTALGITVSFIDNWFEYHILLGSVHCGTNTLRAAPQAKWWEFTP